MRYVREVFANFLHLGPGRPSPGGHGAFVEEVSVSRPESRDPRVLRLILVCWGLIAVKHVVVIWAVWHYRIPIHQLWINFPTWLLGALATAVYFGRTRRPPSQR